MRDTSVFMPLDRYFQRIGLRASIVLCQVPLTLTMLIIVAVTELLSPATLEDPILRLTLLFHVLIFIATLAIPWDRLPSGSFLVIPILDCIALGITHERGGTEFSVVAQLIVFPVVWLAVSVSKVRVLLAIVVAIVTELAPHVVLDQGRITPQELVHIIVLPTVIGAMAITAHLAAKGIVRQRGTLQRLYQEGQGRQRLLDAVVETVSVGVWVVDAEGRDVLINRRLLAERARLEESVPVGAGPGGYDGGAAHSVFLADGETTIDARTDPIARASRGEAFSDELFWAGTGRDRRAFSATARPLRDEDGAFAGSVIAFTDVTALVNALTAKDNFVATISHELRTPLTSILGYLELAIDEPDPVEHREQLEVIERNAARLLNLVNDLLSVASGGVDLQLEDTDFADIADRALSAAKPYAAAHGVEMIRDLERPLPVRLDPNRIGQVLDNLLSNAIKYSPGGGSVTLSARLQDGRLTCSVTDEGIGMDPAEQEQAFTKFFRASRPMETAIPGAGLGLPISKTIVEGHGGTITLKSRRGVGTIVRFTLPAVAVATQGA